MNNLNKVLIDIATNAFVTNGHPDFTVTMGLVHWHVDYLVNVTRNKRAKRVALFATWEEAEARAFLNKKLAAYLLD